MSKPELAAFVIGPLADEAPMAVMQDRVVTRHRLIAAAVLQCAEELGVQLDDHIKLLVQTAVRRIDRHGPSEDLKAIAYISREMTDSRQALIAARAAAEANPNRLSYQARLSSALREAGQPAQAEELCQRAIETAPSAEDSADGIRGLVTEWGVCWGNLGDYTANAYLAAVALADLRGATPPHLDGVEFSMRCFGLGLSQVWASQAAPEHAAAMRGVVSIFGLLGFESTRHSWLRNYERAASSAAPLAKTSSAAVDAILVSAGLLQDSVGARFNIPGLGRLSMDGLQNALEQRYGL